MKGDYNHKTNLPCPLFRKEGYIILLFYSRQEPIGNDFRKKNDFLKIAFRSFGETFL